MGGAGSDQLQSGRHQVHIHHHYHQATVNTFLDLAQYSNSERPFVRIHCKADPNYFLSVRDGQVILAPFHLYDETQHWYKEEKFNTITDGLGHYAFSLVNKSTNQAIKHLAVGHNSKVQLIPYDPDVVDETTLWSQGCYRDCGYKSIRTVVNHKLNLDAAFANRSARDGTPIVIHEWNQQCNQQCNQLWKITHF